MSKEDRNIEIAPDGTIKITYGSFEEYMVGIKMMSENAQKINIQDDPMTLCLGVMTDNIHHLVAVKALKKYQNEAMAAAGSRHKANLLKKAFSSTDGKQAWLDALLAADKGKEAI